MFLVSKVVEILLGKHLYDSEYQETERTTKVLQLALNMVAEHVTLTPKQQMGLALGKGIAFLEKHSVSPRLSRNVANTIFETSDQYVEDRIDIDDRDKLLDKIRVADESGVGIIMCAILDDTAESVDDLLWIQQLTVLYPTFRVNLLLNTAQISINFASHMLSMVLKSQYFRPLAKRLGSQVRVTKTYCPLISLQSNLLDSAAKEAIQEADFVFVKGLNFFETCQHHHKDVFYSFVVYGPISRLYTGFNDFSGIFAFLPAGVVGYEHNNDKSKIETLRAIHRSLNNVVSSSNATITEQRQQQSTSPIRGC
jgi:hypothetical protein